MLKGYKSQYHITIPPMITILLICTSYINVMTIVAIHDLTENLRLDAMTIQAIHDLTENIWALGITS